MRVSPRSPAAEILDLPEKEAREDAVRIEAVASMARRPIRPGS